MDQGNILKDDSFLKNLERYYEYDGWETRYNHFLRIISIDDYLKTLNAKGKALDIGCSSGAQSFSMERKGFQVVGIDITENGIKKARSWAESINSSCQFRIMDINSSDFEDDTFDLVLASEALEHIPDNRRTAEEIHRITKKGGHIIYTMPNGKSGYWKRKKKEMARNDLTDIDDVEIDSSEWHSLRHTIFSPSDIEKITSEGLGLTKVHSTSCGHMIPPRSILIRLLILSGLGYKIENYLQNRKDNHDTGASYIVVYEKS
ncbi:MAG: class I SAM-dependent methyltransferase [Thermoplasmatota archaeon]